MCRTNHSCTKNVWSQRCLGGSIARKDKFPTESIVLDYVWQPRNAKMMYFIKFFLKFGGLEIWKLCISLLLAASRFENVVFPSVWTPRDSKMLYFRTFGDLDIWKCCISLRSETWTFENDAFPYVLTPLKFENVAFPRVWQPRNSKMLYFRKFGSLEIWKCCIS